MIDNFASEVNKLWPSRFDTEIEKLSRQKIYKSNDLEPLTYEVL